MPEYRYKARDKKGLLVTASVFAIDLEAARKQVSETTELFVLEVYKKSSFAGIFALTFFKGRVAPRDLILFTNQLKTLIEAGLPLVEALSFLAKNLTNKTFKAIIAKICTEVGAGTKFSAALAKFPATFNKEYLQLISVAEASGNLDKMLATISKNLEESYFLKKKISSAMAYPEFALFIVFAVTIFMLTAILPKMVIMYNASGTALPTPTLILLKISGFLTHNAFLLLALVGVSFITFKFAYSKSLAFRIFIDKVKTKIPLIGKISYMSSIIKFLETFSLLQKSGLSIIPSLELAKAAIQNCWLEEKMRVAIGLVGEGKTVSYAIEMQRIFPELLYKIIAIGENSGKLTEVMDKTSEFWKNELDDAIKTMTAQIEPALTVVLGILVGFIAIAMYMPMFNMAKVWRKQ